MYLYRILALAIFSVSSCLLCYAQKGEHFDFDGASGLSDKRIRSKLQVIDQRSNKENIGHVERGSGKIVPINPTKPIDQLLSSYYGVINSNENLLLVLHEFNMAYNLNQEHVASFYFDADIFTGSNGKYRFLQRVDSLYEIPLVKDAARQLTETAWEKLTGIFNLYGSDKVAVGDTYYTEQEATNRRQQYKAALPIYQAIEYKKGIYYTAGHFAQHQPTDTGFAVLDLVQTDGSRLITPYYLNQKGKRGASIDGVTYFAIYDGKRWYTGSPNVRMGVENNEFYSKQVFDGITNLALQRAKTYNTGGIIGYGTVLIINSGKKSNVGKESAAYFKTKFDPEYKQFVPIERAGDF